MLTLKDLLTVCSPDFVVVGEHNIQVKEDGIPSWLLDFSVQEVTGWDDGLTIEVCEGSPPCTYLPIPVEHKLKNAIRRVFNYSSVGSALHIVLDDENVEDQHIQWCIENTIPYVGNMRERAACEKCAILLLKVPVKECERIVHGYGREWGL